MHNSSMMPASSARCLRFPAVTLHSSWNYWRIVKDQSPRKTLKKVLERYHAIYYNFRKRFTDLQWKLLLAIACEERVLHPHAFEFLINYRLGAASSVERALRNLSDTGIIQNTPEGWKVSDIRFQRWLVQLYPHMASHSQN